jgi:uncharacterized membrane protein YqhA
MTPIIIALTPFAVNLFMSLGKMLTDVQDTAGKRILLGVLSLIGVVAGNALAGTPIDPTSLGGLVQEVLLAVATFLASHGSYSLFASKSEPVPNA